MDETFSKYSENRVILKNALRAVEKKYDYIIIDCPPILRGTTTNALTASNSVLIPINCGHFSLEAIDKLFNFLIWIREISNPSITVEGIMLTMYQKNSKVTEIAERELKLKYNKFMLEAVIPHTNLLNEATFYGKPICLYKINSDGAIAYLNLANEIINRSENQIPSEDK
jgi:chromosome partitioning protein